MASKQPPAGGKKPVKTATGAAIKAPAQTASAPIVAAPAPEPVAAVTEPVPPFANAATKVAEKVAHTPTETVEKLIEDAAPQIADTANKGTAVMETTIEKSQAIFAELNDRAKAQIEKNNKLVAEATDFAKGNVEALVESGKIAAKGFETIGQDAAEYSRKSFENATATLKSLSAVKSPADFFKLQSDYLRSAFDSIVAETSKNTEAVIKLAGDAAQPISNRFAVAVEKVKTVA